MKEFASKQAFLANASFRMGQKRKPFGQRANFRSALDLIWPKKVTWVGKMAQWSVRLLKALRHELGFPKSIKKARGHGISAVIPAPESRH